MEQRKTVQEVIAVVFFKRYKDKINSLKPGESFKAPWTSFTTITAEHNNELGIVIHVPVILTKEDITDEH